MALLTLGTATTSTLSAIKWNAAIVSTAPSDLAALNALIKGIKANSSVVFKPMNVIAQGLLYVPDRGNLRLHEGDYIGVDPNTGEVLVISAATAAAASWVHS